MPEIERDTHLPEALEADVDVMLVFNLLRTHAHINPHIDQTLKGRRLRGAQFNALLALSSAGDEGLLMGEIGERLVVTKSNVTGLVDRLESQGLARRAEEHSPLGARPALEMVEKRLNEMWMDLRNRGAEEAALLEELLRAWRIARQPDGPLAAEAGPA